MRTRTDADIEAWQKWAGIGQATNEQAELLGQLKKKEVKSCAGC